MKRGWRASSASLRRSRLTRKSMLRSLLSDPGPVSASRIWSRVSRQFGFPASTERASFSERVNATRLPPGVSAKEKSGASLTLAMVSILPMECPPHHLAGVQVNRNFTLVHALCGARVGEQRLAAGRPFPASPQLYDARRGGLAVVSSGLERELEVFRSDTPAKELKVAGTDWHYRL